MTESQHRGDHSIAFNYRQQVGGSDTELSWLLRLITARTC